VYPTTQTRIRKQHRLHKRRILSPTAENIQSHKKFRNKINSEIKAAKKKYFTELIKSTERNPKQQAKVLKTVIPSSKQRRTSPTTINYEGKQYTDPVEIADALNDRFITIGHKISETIPPHEEPKMIPDNTPTSKK
jgi:hypothetical protein